MKILTNPCEDETNSWNIFDKSIWPFYKNPQSNIILKLYDWVKSFERIKINEDRFFIAERFVFQGHKVVQQLLAHISFEN